ncbi:hypothetical protein LOK49_LG13G01678 [Camellia lanceoleosa]|uniref:Uncharacterized protein n=1 Tax=Camellia lanceoleosa TaxID=1840588 RepID=A0ACC0FLS8_9ERIC|nr:hypothetical protein LOK49_LG13G01678 [Camellia lanceoleosa]
MGEAEILPYKSSSRGRRSCCRWRSEERKDLRSEIDLGGRKDEELLLVEFGGGATVEVERYDEIWDEVEKELGLGNSVAIYEVEMDLHTLGWIRKDERGVGERLTVAGGSVKALTKGREGVVGLLV